MTDCSTSARLATGRLDYGRAIDAIVERIADRLGALDD
jgi:hypothetical protein